MLEGDVVVGLRILSGQKDWCPVYGSSRWWWSWQGCHGRELLLDWVGANVLVHVIFDGDHSTPLNWDCSTTSWGTDHLWYRVTRVILRLVPVELTLLKLWFPAITLFAHLV